MLLAQAAAAIRRTLRGGAATFFSALLQLLKHVHADALAHGGGCARDWDNVERAKGMGSIYVTTDSMIARADECIELHATLLAGCNHNCSVANSGVVVRV